MWEEMLLKWAAEPELLECSHCDSLTSSVQGHEMTIPNHPEDALYSPVWLGEKHEN